MYVMLTCNQDNSRPGPVQQPPGAMPPNTPDAEMPRASGAWPTEATKAAFGATPQDTSDAPPEHVTRQSLPKRRQDAEHPGALAPALSTQPKAYFAFLSSRRICSSASITSSRETRLRAKLSFKLNCLVGGLNANT